MNAFEIRELSNYFSGSYIAIKDTAVAAEADRNRTFPFYVDSIFGDNQNNLRAEGVVLRRTGDNVRRHTMVIAYDQLILFPKWCTGTVNLGSSISMSVSRIPGRQWKRGITREFISYDYNEINELHRVYYQTGIPRNLQIRDDGGFYLLLDEMLNPTYLSWDEAMDSITNGRALGRALSSKLHLSSVSGYKVPFIGYKGKLIGYVQAGVPVLMDTAKKWKECVEETSGKEVEFVTKLKRSA